MSPGRSSSPTETLGDYSRTEAGSFTPQISNASGASTPHFSPRPQHHNLRIASGSSNSLGSLSMSHGDRVDQVRHGQTPSTSSTGNVSGSTTGQTTTRPSGPRHIASATLRPERPTRSASDSTPARGEGSGGGNGSGDTEREQTKEGKVNSALAHRASRSGLSTRASRSGRATPHTPGHSLTHPNGATPHLPSSSARVRLLPYLPHSKDTEIAPTVQMYWSKAPVWGTMPNHGMRAHSVTLVDSVAWIFGGCDERGCWKDLWLFNTGAFTSEIPHLSRLTWVFCFRNDAVVSPGSARRHSPSMSSSHCDACGPKDRRFRWRRRAGLLRHCLRIGHRSSSVAESRIPRRYTTPHYETCSHRRLLRWKDLGVRGREWVASAERCVDAGGKLSG